MGSFQIKRRTAMFSFMASAFILGTVSHAAAFDDYAGKLPQIEIVDGHKLVSGQSAEDGFPGPDVLAIILYTSIGDRMGWVNYSIVSARTNKKYGASDNEKIRKYNRLIVPASAAIRMHTDGSYKTSIKGWFQYRELLIPVIQVITIYTDGRDKPYTVTYSVDASDIRREKKDNPATADTLTPEKIWLSEPAQFSFTEKELWGTGSVEDWKKASWRDYGFEHKVVIHGFPEPITIRFVMSSYNAGSALMLTKTSKKSQTTKADIDRVFKEMVP